MNDFKQKMDELFSFVEYLLFRAFFLFFIAYEVRRLVMWLLNQ